LPSGLIKSGYALLAGLTNTGKSSLLNALTETSISPTAPQPASTRMPITGICTPGNSQICFVDTPPLDGASDSSMVEWVDVVVMLLNIVTFEEDLQRPEVSGFLESAGERPLVLALGRNDYVKTEHREAYLNKARYTNRFNAAVTVNPLTGSGVKDLLNAVLASIPLRERLFPRSIKTLNSKRFLISEQIRASLFAALPPETAMETAVQIEETSLRDGKLYIRSNLIVSRASSKGMLIGRRGQTLERIGQLSTESIERYTGDRCRLDLWVKVREAWPENKTDMLEFGYVC